MLHIDHHSTQFKAQPYHYLNTIYYFITGKELFKKGEQVSQDINYWLNIFEEILDRVVISVAEKGFDIEKSKGMNYATPRPDGDSVCTLFLQDLLFERLPNDFISYSKNFENDLSLDDKYNQWKAQNIEHLKKFLTLLFQVSFWGDNFGFIPSDPYFSKDELKELRKTSRFLNTLASNSSDESISKGLTVLDSIYNSGLYSLQTEDRLSYDQTTQKRQEIIQDLVKVITLKNITINNGVVLIDVSELEKSKNIKIDAELCQIAFEVVLQRDFNDKGETRPNVQPVLMIKRHDPKFEYYSLSTFTIHDHQHNVPLIIQSIFKRLNIAEQNFLNTGKFDLEEIFSLDISDENFYISKNVHKGWAGGNFAGGADKKVGTQLTAEQISLIVTQVLGKESVAIPDLSQLSEE